MKYWMDDRLRLALLKEKAAYRDFWRKCDEKTILDADCEIQEYYSKNPGSYISTDPKCPATKVLHDFLDRLYSFKIAFELEIPHGENLKSTLDVLNPFNENFPDKLPFHFHEYPPVAQLVDSTGDPFDALKGKVTPEHHYIVPTNLAISNLQPWERLLRIDLRRSKKDIREDIDLYLSRVVELRNQPVGWADNYRNWEPDTSREQKNAWRDLKIWRMRRGKDRKPFSQISRELRIKVDAAKKAFAHAYLLIEERPYDPEKLKKILKKVELKELKRTCTTCSENPKHGGICKELCPDVLAYCEQDDVSLFGRLTKTGIAEPLPPKTRNKTKLTDD